MTARRRVVGMLLMAAACAACGSPEATRTRGGGPGGYTGNRPEIVRMHEGSQQYWRTPELIPTEPPPLEPAAQAREFSRQ